MEDPNLANLKSGADYRPQVAQKDSIIDVGEYSYQKFTGEWSHRQRAEVLRRRTNLLTAVIEALKVANEAEALKSSLTGKKIFDYLHRGK